MEVVEKVSKAATTLCMWCHAMDLYSKVAKEVEPKKLRLQEMNEMLDKSNAILAEKQAELAVGGRRHIAEDVKIVRCGGHVDVSEARNAGSRCTVRQSSW